ncbi:MAG: MlaD family protein [Kiritimatiellae bacterium]|nr:MlaD family protein [Kiritimatiellia bacterium]
MSGKANPAAIGAFVLAGAAIAVGALIALGTFNFTKHASRHVIFFESSLSGLDVGAPVEYRGVRIGQVSSIALEYNPRTRAVLIPVCVDLEDALFKYVDARADTLALKDHVQQGLRAQLQAQNLLTGKLKVMLVDKPGTPIRLVGAYPGVPEIPAIPTLVENISHSIEKLPLARIAANIDVSMKQIAELASSGELTNAVLLLSGALIELKSLSHRLNADLPAVLDTVRQNGDSLLRAQTDLEVLLKDLHEMLAAGSPERQQAAMTLRSLEDAANSLRNLIDYLQVHPEALLSGKKEK